MDDVKVPLPTPFLLRSIYIRSSDCQLDENFDPLPPNQQLMGFSKFEDGQVRNQENKFEIAGNSESVKSCLFTTKFHFGYKVVGTEPLTDDTPFVANISAEIAADYQVTTSDFPDQEKLNQWAGSNFLLHVWPYWREFCQNMQVRMGLPVTLVPMLILNSPSG